MTLSREEYLAKWRELHGNAEPSRLVRSWLLCAYLLARPLARLGIAPDVISLFGVVAAVAAIELAAGGAELVAAAIILLSLIFDGLDGAVAVLRQRVTRWGAVIDGVLDRVAEALWAATLVIVGVPIAWALAGWSLAMVQEYQRARFAAVDRLNAPIRVSLAERPVRALLMASSVALAALTPAFVTPIAMVWVGLQMLGSAQVWSASRSLPH